MTVTKADFEEQMKVLKDKGYRVITSGSIIGFSGLQNPGPEEVSGYHH